MFRINFVCFFLVFFFFIVNSDNNGGEVEDEHEFIYATNAKKGPQSWGTLKPEWKACQNGQLQSPIDLNDDKAVILPALGHLQRIYNPAPAILKNRGHDIMVEWEGDAGEILINGTSYKLRQCHWHTPSEHTLNGKKLSMEIHLVHVNSEGSIAVIGILYEIGTPDPFLEKILDIIKSSNKFGTSLGEMNPWDIKFGCQKYFRYVGSLTVPPCTEGVVWSIVHKVRTASKEQIRTLREAVHDGFQNNARPLQKIGDKKVYLYRPERL